MPLPSKMLQIEAIKECLANHQSEINEHIDSDTKNSINLISEYASKIISNKLGGEYIFNEDTLEQIIDELEENKQIEKIYCVQILDESLIKELDRKSFLNQINNRNIKLKKIKYFLKKKSTPSPSVSVQLEAIKECLAKHESEINELINSNTKNSTSMISEYASNIVTAKWGDQYSFSKTTLHQRLNELEDKGEIRRIYFLRNVNSNEILELGFENYTTRKDSIDHKLIGIKYFLTLKSQLDLKAHNIKFDIHFDTDVFEEEDIKIERLRVDRLNQYQITIFDNDDIFNVNLSHDIRPFKILLTRMGNTKDQKISENLIAKTEEFIGKRSIIITSSKKEISSFKEEQSILGHLVVDFGKEYISKINIKDLNSINGSFYSNVNAIELDRLLDYIKGKTIAASFINSILKNKQRVKTQSSGDEVQLPCAITCGSVLIIIR